MTIQVMVHPRGKNQWRYLRDLVQYLNHPALMCAECAIPKAKRQCTLCTVREDMESIVKQAMSPWTAEFSGKKRNWDGRTAKINGFFWSGIHRNPEGDKHPTWIVECSYCGKRAVHNVPDWNGHPVSWTCPGCGRNDVLTGPEEHRGKNN